MPALDDNKKVLAKYVKNVGSQPYLQVSGRVFSAHKSKQLISITTELEETEKHYRVRATAKVLNTHMPDYASLPIEAMIGTFTGTAQSPKALSGKTAEATNPLETCETSAVGRALGYAGFGDLESIASAEEVETAVDRRKSSPSVALTEDDIIKRDLGNALKEKGIVSLEQINAASNMLFNVDSKKLTPEQRKQWLDGLQKPEPEIREVTF